MFLKLIKANIINRHGRYRLNNRRSLNRMFSSNMNPIHSDNSKEHLSDEIKIVLKNELELLHSKEKLLYNDLKEWRKKRTQIEGTPLYSICRNDVLESVIRQLPTNVQEFAILSGVGPVMIEKRSQDILEIVSAHIKPIMESREVLKQQGLMTDEARQQIISDVNLPSWWSEKPAKEKKERKPRPKKIEISESVIKEIRQSNSFDSDDLTPSQKAVADQILNNDDNVFLTGSAGTGKSYLLKYLINQLKDLHGENAVAVTAPTGVAAINIEGQTVHSFAGIGYGLSDPNTLIAKVMKSKKLKSTWKKTKVLIIDEISMMDSSLFELLDSIARAVFDRMDLPFGGMRIIFVGDLCSCHLYLLKELLTEVFVLKVHYGKNASLRKILFT